jgi:hypothetical protein
MKRLLLSLFLFSGAALACEKIDYVEVKDWPVEQVEKAFCDAKSESLQMTIRQIHLMGSTLVDYHDYDAPINRCDAQVAMYGRVLKNVHKRELPTCKK